MAQVVLGDKVELNTFGQTFFWGKVRSITKTSENQIVTFFCADAIADLMDKKIFDSVYAGSNYQDNTTMQVALSGTSYQTTLTTGTPMPPILATRLLHTTEKNLRRKTEAGYITHISVFNGAGSSLKAQSQFVGKNSTLNNIAVQLEHGGSGNLNHNLNIKDQDNAQLYTYNITNADLPNDGAPHWVTFSPDIMTEGGTPYYIEIEPNDTSGTAIKWFASETPYGTGGEGVTTDHLGAELIYFLTAGGGDNKRGYFLFECVWESDWKPMAEGRDFTVDYANSMLNWGGTKGVVPSFETQGALSGTSYNIAQISYGTADLNTKSLVEQVVNDWARDIFHEIDTTGFTASKVWATYVISQKSVYDALMDILSAELGAIRSIKTGTNFKLIVEALHQPTSVAWDAYSAQEQATRTFMHGDDSSTDGFIKLSSHKTKIDDRGVANDIITVGPDSDHIFQGLYESKIADVGIKTAIIKMGQAADYNAVITTTENALNDNDEGLITDIITVNTPIIDANVSLFHTNQIVYLKNSELGVDNLCKIMRLDVDIDNNWLVKLKLSRVTPSVQAWPDLRFPAESLQGPSHIDSSQGLGEVMPGANPIDNTQVAQAGYGSGAAIGPVSRIPYGEFPTKDGEKHLTHILVRNQGGYTYNATGTPVIAIGCSGAATGSGACDAVIAARLAASYDYTEPGGLARKVVLATITLSSITTLAWPCVLREVTVGDAIGGPFAYNDNTARVTFWTPSNDETVPGDKPAHSLYYPEKKLFKNSKIIVQYICDNS